ncbi:hypothetical protein C2845_PM03G06950 [Panicum miliaceum]|uniref:Trehalose 6-phosphate phosphatase n=1 Tax=Panicum miliaceum TaxID=4540 RepID=A0A3L6T8Q5_PANMI|nr:hypothetical protein C2845_PM03G06950 [Panicum miliaceum]
MDAGDGSPAASPLDAVAAAFKSRVVELQDLVLARSMFPATLLPDLASVNASVTAMESRVQDIRRCLQEELDAIPKAKKLIERSLKQQEKLQHMLANVPSGMHEDVFATHLEQSSSRMLPDCFNYSSSVPEYNECELKIKEEPVAAPKKGRAPAPRWYMRGRLTLEKVNIAINEVASYADVNAHLVTCPKKKLSEDTWDKALELRDIAATEAVKGKPFFLEVDIKGPGLKLDNTGKSILTSQPIFHSHISEAGKKTVLFLDYDGTLSPIVDEPDNAIMSDQVFDFVKLTELYYAGSHGMDIIGPMGKTGSATDNRSCTNSSAKQDKEVKIFQAASEFIPMIYEVFRFLVEKMKGINGAKVENNKFCVSVHYRNVNEKDWPTVARCTDDVLKAYPRLRLSHGRKVLEVHPVIDWNKGKAVEFLLDSLGLDDSDNVLPIYTGDDRTDEDAFKVLWEDKRGFGILVSSVPKESHAVYSPVDPSEVMDFLKRLVKWKEEEALK